VGQECFLTTGIHYLVLHDLLISKNALHRFVTPVLGFYVDIRNVVQTGMSVAN
jgi:carbamoyltransferase